MGTGLAYERTLEGREGCNNTVYTTSSSANSAITVTRGTKKYMHRLRPMASSSCFTCANNSLELIRPSRGGLTGVISIACSNLSDCTSICFMRILQPTQAMQRARALQSAPASHNPGVRLHIGIKHAELVWTNGDSNNSRQIRFDDFVGSI